MVNVEALATCLSSSACIVNQLSSGLIIGMLLFLVASGVTLIFGVLHVINFAHGTFYMIGAYTAYTIYTVTGSYFLAAAGGALGAAIIGVLFERFIISRVYGENILMQLLVCYAFILIVDDLVKIIWGAQYLAMGVPDVFRMPPLRIAGGFVPPFYVFLVAVAVVILFGSVLLIAKTRFGKIVRAAAHNQTMVSVLGIRVPLYFALLFGFGCALAGVAGALAAPVRSLTPGMGVGILIESFIVTVIGGMGSITGAFLAALLLGLVRSIGSIGFPLFVDGAMFAIMAIILIVRPQGLLGQGEVR
ncbi:branched-chain amino acid ABC transporter permease [Acuticoccus sediminis]|uniref:Branched-chain amino acid ABC transporter permease n=1 Tax=Acuticoccus sediminis TaxID=2184697 RepID=A0A8B2NGH5_9HYPH|nr:branched-chain amino acid ABC transporter permease [Acuticoccus sediminis]RAH98360.1 branched-chain amino acid ABC transporter permease [Acuticoccus sediminis]